LEHPLGLLQVFQGFFLLALISVKLSQEEIPLSREWF
jgi:hypothetical protein